MNLSILSTFVHPPAKSVHPPWGPGKAPGGQMEMDRADRAALCHPRKELQMSPTTTTTFAALARCRCVDTRESTEHEWALLEGAATAA